MLQQTKGNLTEGLGQVVFMSMECKEGKVQRPRSKFIVLWMERDSQQTLTGQKVKSWVFGKSGIYRKSVSQFLKFHPSAGTCMRSSIIYPSIPFQFGVLVQLLNESGFVLLQAKQVKSLCLMRFSALWSSILLLLLSRFSRVRLCNPRDDSPPGSPFPGILQARTLEWVAITQKQ